MIDIKDVVIESKSGNITPIAGLSKDQTVGVLANIKKDVNQLPGVISEKGLGSYGLSLANLQLLKIVKRGISQGVDLETTLNDASVFTGKQSVNNVNVLLINEDLQKTLMQAVITMTTTTLQNQGIISGTEGPEIAGGVAGVAAKFSVKEIKDFSNGQASPEVANNITATKTNADFAVNLTDTKASSALQKVNGIGGGSTKVVKSSTETIQTPQLNKNVDNFIGSKRVPSAVSKKDTALLTEQANSKNSIPSNALTGVSASSAPTIPSSTKASTVIKKGDLF